MKAVFCAFVAALAFVLIFETVSAIPNIKCYRCNSWFQNDCGDFFENRTFNMDNCPTGTKMCRKIVQEVYYNDHWDVRYIRECARTGEVGDYEGRSCMERVGTYRVKLRYCTCDNQHGCNTASSISIPVISLLVPALAFLLMLLRTL